MNYEEPIHRIIGGIVHSPAFADKLPQQREFYNLTPPEYWELLHAHASAFRMWKVTYMHTLPSHEAVMDWYRGTGMRPYLQALDDAGRKKFEADHVVARTRRLPFHEVWEEAGVEVDDDSESELAVDHGGEAAAVLVGGELVQVHAFGTDRRGRIRWSPHPRP